MGGTVPEGESFELIVANLPYVAEVDWPSLQPEVSEWEPREALLAGSDGLAAIREVVPQVGAGTLALEIGAGQAEAVMELFRDAGFVNLRTRRDLAGVERVVWGSRG
jgi:release factor glutamine methyltransferase